MQPLQEKPYEPGQPVINRLFGCRGIILKSWNAKLVDKNYAIGKFTKESENLDENSLETLANPPEPKRNICGYTVMLDIKDASHCNYYHVGITFIPDPDIKSEIKTEKSMDYAFHDDLIPYSSSSDLPIMNPMVWAFFVHDAENQRFLPTKLLEQFYEKTRSAFEIKTVYRQTTNGVRVTVVPFPLGEVSSRFYFRYVTRIENLTTESLTLRERFWKVYSMKGKLESVSGKGVIGMEPVLSPENRVFQYHSHVVTQIPSTYMWGIFRFEKASGGTVDVKIPHVALKHVPEEDNRTGEELPNIEPEPSDK